ncbi:MAG: peptidoglycan-associated lipoprotein Pal [Bordetella sp.]|nr:MAG: peptidoglycan-associated lipoprotein Pal [Bordetella sp.]
MKKITKNMITIVVTSSILACTSMPLDENNTFYSKMNEEDIQFNQTSDSFDEQNIPNKAFSIFFDFDKSSISEEDKTILESYARYLIMNRNQIIKIEGHTDERGSSEYNLELGQRRADSISRILLSLGVEENQIETISFGKDKPKSIGSTEENYSKNRRADLIYKH